MRSHLHGIASMGFLAISMASATAAAFLTRWMLGVLYLVICVICLAAILYVFCAKCPCQARCGHVIPGKLAALVRREPGAYSKLEGTLAAGVLLLLLGLPQVWLWRYPALAAAFWVFAAMAGLEMRAFVCRACDNVFCLVKIAG